jgi:hypothetical protein
MRVGIIAGGFKPLTSGHFSKILMSLSTNAQTILVYSPRSRGDGEDIIPESNLLRMWDFLTPRLEKLGVTVRRARTTPIKDTFAIIGVVRCILDSTGRKPDETTAKYFGINPAATGAVLYGSPDDIHSSFGRLIGTPQERMYFGSMYKDQNLSFCTLSGTEIYVSKGMSEQGARMLSEVRGTEVRNMLSSLNAEAIKFLPEFLTEAEKKQMFGILTR